MKQPLQKGQVKPPSLIAWLEGQPVWKFAKTMAEIPHHYVWKDKSLEKTPDREDWPAIVNAIRTHGTPRKFGKNTFIYFAANGFEYWTMFASDEASTIINRARLFNQYDQVASVYDDLFTGDIDREEDHRVAGMLAGLPDMGHVLDIGCGTGLLLDILPIQTRNYAGLDPSAAMLAKFSEKHPEHKCRSLSLEAFMGSEHGRFANAVSLFGSINYILPAFLPRIIPEILTPKGRFFFMVFKPDYEPVTAARAGVTLNHFRYNKADLEIAFRVPAQEFNQNYWIFANDHFSKEDR